MLSAAAVVVAALVWLGLLFGVALYAERHPRVLAPHWRHVYALSLAVYCTSWTFYGTVTQAARYDWPLPPTFVGTLLLYLFGAGALLRLVELARASNATSIADLIATRLGKDAWLAAAITLVAALGLIPYIALQLKAVSMSFSLLTAAAPGASQPPWRDSALYVALLMALFAMLFGTRRASVTEHNRGLVLAMAFESLFKLAAMLALGAFVWFGLQLPATPAPPPRVDAGGFLPLVVLGGLAMFTLPHQFHVGVVECRDPRDVLTARWLFPLYLVLIALPVLPLARAGDALLAGRGVPSDLYVLALPLSQAHAPLALFAFLGGLSAATGMVVVSTLTLSLMIGNHWLAPGLLRGAWGRGGQGDLRADVLLLRRLGIALLMLLAWAYSRHVAGNAALADVGALSFSALATLAPPLAFAVWRPQTPPRAVLLGLLAAFATWLWVLPLPLLLADAAPAWLRHGPFGIAWLAPAELFGLEAFSPLGRAVTASLAVGTALPLLAGGWLRPALQAGSRPLQAEALAAVARRFLPAAQVQALLSGAHPEAAVERALSAVLGASSARVLLDAARRRQPGADLDTVAAIIGEASQDLRFNQRVLEAALENMSQGISVVDAQLRLVAWNRRYADLFGFPPGLLQVGMPIAEASRWALRHVLQVPQQALERALQVRLAHMRAGTSHLSERVFPDGSIIEIRGNPMPGGGFVATFTDVTAFRRAEAELKRSNETLEQRVAERTLLLESAKREAEQANEAKGRFLAAIGHDLLQPLHAAHLFTDALRERGDAEQRRLAAHIGGALEATTDLLTTLLDMSRLEAGGLQPQRRVLPLAEVLEPLVAQFRALAAERGLRLRHVPTRAWVECDPQLLRRVLQNFLANALRYTERGSVLLGVRRMGDRLGIEVHDTGPGIPDAQREAIFEEFRRGEGAPGQGLGLGLAIARRIADLMDTPIGLRSQPGRGSCFCVQVPRRPPPPAPRLPARGLAGLPVLVVDNDAAARAALAALLRGWGCVVHEAGDGAAALQVQQQSPCALWILDYHLDHGEDGIGVHARLCAMAGAVPALLVSADRSGEVARLAQEAGLSLLAKPLRPLALKSVLDRLRTAAEATAQRA
ncbi:hybrid sensor histidine kinase/response regulator [Thermomonas flagellata]|uniref:hybrid sensor histidine kinase/response regulator n=1 Tax=Thermomonas flagellata TaxID=2888524 RepID=UPI001F04CBBA|nr:PAS-domain containing protein [Thermomonas flagellata]